MCTSALRRHDTVSEAAWLHNIIFLQVMQVSGYLLAILGIILQQATSLFQKHKRFTHLMQGSIFVLSR